MSGMVQGEARNPARVVFVFSPLRSEFRGMGVDLLDSSNAFRNHMDSCNAALSPFVDWSLDDVLRGHPGVPPFYRLDVSQPVLFAMAASLAKLWDSFGVQPDAVAGHSVGEIAAAATCGALLLPDAAKVAATWGRSSMRLEGTGAMASIPLSAKEVERRAAPWSQRLWISGLNAPSWTAISGDEKAVDELLEDLAADDIIGRSMEIAAPGHSPGVRPIHDWFLEELSAISPRSGTVPFYSAAVGGLVDSASLDAHYWSSNLRQPVLFESAIRSLSAAGYNVFIEVGPRPVLGEAITEILDGEKNGIAIGTLDQGDSSYFLTSLAKAYVNGVDVNWQAVCGDTPQIPVQFWSTQLGAPVRSGAANGGGSLARHLGSVPKEEREAAVLDLVRREVANVLGYSSQATVDPGRRFKDLGFDSPTAVDLRNRLIRVTGLALNSTLAFDYPTPKDIAHKLFLDFEGRGKQQSDAAEDDGVLEPIAGEAALSRIDDLDVASLVELSLKQRDELGEAP
jgi:malonyl CoA-acyl carrier protein transacylase